MTKTTALAITALLALAACSSSGTDEAATTTAAPESTTTTIEPEPTTTTTDEFDLPDSCADTFDVGIPTDVECRPVYFIAALDSFSQELDQERTLDDEDALEEGRSFCRTMTIASDPTEAILIELADGIDTPEISEIMFAASATLCPEYWELMTDLEGSL